MSQANPPEPGCIFCKIVAGQIPAKVVYRTSTRPHRCTC
jgi:hypothetical protein